MSEKVSISVPTELFQRFEKARRARGLARSAAVQRAMRRWTAEPDIAGWDWEYVEAYRRKPQDPDDVEGWLLAGLETWEKRPRRSKRTRNR